MLRPKSEKGKDGDLKSPANMPLELKDAEGKFHPWGCNSKKLSPQDMFSDCGPPLQLNFQIILRHLLGSHEIKRHLLLGRKAMTNLDSILKIRDITLPTKVHQVKAMIFPDVIYRC